MNRSKDPKRLTLDEVKRYLAEHTDPDGSIGEPMTSCHCLAACTLDWLYPDSYPCVHHGNREAEIILNGELTTVALAPELTEVANKFDTFPDKRLQEVTLAELQAYMPELFS